MVKPLPAAFVIASNQLLELLNTSENENKKPYFNVHDCSGTGFAYNGQRL